MNMNKLPSVSIITPSLNQGSFLEQSIQSVLGQQYPNLELIIIDGGSDDNSIEIIKKYEKHIAYWVSETDRGQSDAINKGLRIASGDIVNWLNADDYYEPDTLQKVTAQFSDDQVNVVCGRGKVVTEQGGFIQFSRGTDVYPGNLAKTIGWARIDQPETFFRRNVLEQTGLLNADLHYVMDKAWWINYLLLFRLDGVRMFEEVLVNFRLHDASKTVSQSECFARETDALFLHLAEQNYLETEAKGIREFTDTHEPKDLNNLITESLDLPLVKQVLHYYLLHRADEFYFQHQREKAKTCLSIIDSSLLAAEERSLYQKLKTRCRWVPVPLVKLMRK
ncbi:MAG: glycosyltransferase family 2 protein [Cyclobacteriaceae bacterium]